MAVTVKTLIKNHGELHWGTRHAQPDYHYGLALDIGEDGLLAQVVYVLSDLGDGGEALVVPEILASCYTLDDLATNGIVPSDLMGEDDDPSVKGWFCIEESFFRQGRCGRATAKQREP